MTEAVPSAPPRAPELPTLREPLLVFGASAAAVFVLGLVARFVPFVATNLLVFVAAVFLYFPLVAMSRRGEDWRAYGFQFRPLRRPMLTAAVVVGGLFPLFVVGYVAFYSVLCSHGGAMTELAPPGLCRRFGGWAGLADPSLPPRFWVFVATQLVVVALPEELFFRGYLLARLEAALPPGRRWGGGGVGLALVLSSALFAVSHVLVLGDPRRLATFFPGLLFGWLRSATGTVLAGTLVHAGANILMAVVEWTLLR